MQVSTGKVTKLGPSRLYTAVAPSPDGEYLLVAWLERPFSYNVPCGRFPKRIQLWDKYHLLPICIFSQPCLLVDNTVCLGCNRFCKTAHLATHPVVGGICTTVHFSADSMVNVGWWHYAHEHTPSPTCSPVSC